MSRPVTYEKMWRFCLLTSAWAISCALSNERMVGFCLAFSYNTAKGGRWKEEKLIVVFSLESKNPALTPLLLYCAKLVAVVTANKDVRNMCLKLLMRMIG